jgi:EAL domain-containing protein (putative c-di-GMP-specific phosphodiesterase class I)
MQSLAANHPNWSLVNHAEGQLIGVPADGTELTVGRRSGVGLRIGKPTISSNHAVIFVRDGTLIVRDLQSTNGTFVNGQPVQDETILNHGDLIQFAEEVFQVGALERRNETATQSSDSVDAALEAIQFTKLIDDCAVVPFYQPIVRMDTRGVVGYEVLGRSMLFGLSSPDAMFRAASRFRMEAELSRLFRREGMKRREKLPGTPGIFLNTHPAELVEPETLCKSMTELREQAPQARVVLEIHEAAVTNSESFHELRKFLRELSVILAFDDFGSGQARLHELVEVAPEVVKFDLDLCRGIHSASPRKQKMVEQLVRITLDLGIAPLAEGVESKGDHDVCRQIGFEMGQGYYYGRPGQAASFVPPDPDAQPV